MSITPKIVKKGLNKSVKLHMRVENKSKKNISGQIVFIITTPTNKKEILKDTVIVKKLSKTDKYYDYLIRKNNPIGRYYVDGSFNFDKQKVQSETYKNDFFDVLKK